MFGGFIYSPLLLDSCKDVEHSCPQCRRIVGKHISNLLLSSSLFTIIVAIVDDNSFSL
jgi:hypothetical protein